MAAEAHLTELNEKHRDLEQAINAELSRPHADDLRVQELKPRKIKIKRHH